MVRRSPRSVRCAGATTRFPYTVFPDAPCRRRERRHEALRERREHQFAADPCGRGGAAILEPVEAREGFERVEHEFDLPTPPVEFSGDMSVGGHKTPLVVRMPTTLASTNAPSEGLCQIQPLVQERRAGTHTGRSSGASAVTAPSCLSGLKTSPDASQSLMECDAPRQETRAARGVRMDVLRVTVTPVVHASDSLPSRLVRDALSGGGIRDLGGDKRARGRIEKGVDA